MPQSFLGAPEVMAETKVDKNQVKQRTQINTTFSTAFIPESLNSNAGSDLNTANNDVAIGKIAMARKLVASVPCRVRAYTTSANRTADQSRQIGTVEAANSGLLLEITIGSGFLTLDFEEIIELFNADNPNTNIIYFAVQNFSGAGAVITVTLTSFVLED